MVKQKRASRVWRQIDFEPKNRSNSRVLPQRAAFFSSARPPTPLSHSYLSHPTPRRIVSSAYIISWPDLKQTQNNSTTQSKNNVPIFLGFGTGRHNTNWSNPDFEKEVYKCFGVFFLKVQVVADGDSHVYIHLIVIDPARVFLERGECFPSLQSLPGGELSCHLEQGSLLLHKSCEANYQPIPT